MNDMLLNTNKETDLKISRVNIREDLELIWKWWNLPHVECFWSMKVRLQPFKIEQNKSFKIEHLKKYLEYNLENRKVNPRVVSLGSKKIAYIEDYLIKNSLLIEHEELYHTDCGFHCIIGHEELTGIGMTQKLSLLFFEWIFEEYPTAQKIVIDPDINNSFAIRAAMKQKNARRLKDLELPHKVAAIIVFPKSNP